MFPDTELVRGIQGDLDIIIQEGVSNIVQLLRNADSGASPSSSHQAEFDTLNDKSKLERIQKWDQRSKSRIGKKDSIAKRLVTEGLLTEKMVKDLSKELNESKRKSNKRK